MWALETFTAPTGWRSRALVQPLDESPEVTLWVPHPHDVLFAKLERMTESDVEHARRILAELPLSPDELRALAAESPYLSGVIEDPERIARFRYGLARLEKLLG